MSLSKEYEGIMGYNNSFVLENLFGKELKLMAKDLSFWKYEEAVDYKPYDVYISLSDGKMVDGVAILPIDEIMTEVNEAFSDWEKLSDNVWEYDDESIEIYTTEQFVRFDCYGVSQDNMNKLIDIMIDFDCCIYDSSIDVRFE